MNKDNAYTQDSRNQSSGPALFFLFAALAALFFAGCTAAPPHRRLAVDEPGDPQRHVLSYLDSEQCNAFLDPLGLENIRYVPVVPQANLLFVRGAPDQLDRAQLVLDVVDSIDEYCVENLGPASKLGSLPPYEQIEAALGNISIGTFAHPPANYVGAGSRAIIDVQGDSIVAFLPVRYRKHLLDFLALHEAEKRLRDVAQSASTRTESPSKRTGGAVYKPPAPRAVEPEAKPNYIVITDAADRRKKPEKTVESPTAAAQTVKAATADDRAVSDTSNAAINTETGPQDESPMTVKIVFEHVPAGTGVTETKAITDRAVPENGEDILDMTLPETITVFQLLDLAGKYMGLNYVYDPREIPNQSVALKLHGKLEGQMKVKNLYALLETVLGFMGMAMIRQEENLVAVVKIDKALETQPELVHAEIETVKLGDTVVTRAFNIRHVDILSVITLLQDMKLSVQSTALEKTNLLLVTCHSDRMNRIERLVEMVDRPGRPTECWFRRLRYTTAASLLAKIHTLAQELEGIAVAQMPTTVTPSVKPVAAAVPKPPQPKSMADKSVYLDIDERTNRILMIGFAEELAQVEKLIDALDVVQEDPRYARIFDVRNIDAQTALEKLEKLEVLKVTDTAAPGKEAAAGGGDSSGRPLVTVLEETNQLLVRATSDQQMQIAEYLDYIDVAPDSVKSLGYYEIKHIKAAKAREILEELDLVSVSGDAVVSTFQPGPNEPAVSQGSRSRPESPRKFRQDRAQVVLSESGNALFIMATVAQHEQLFEIIKYVDRKTPEEELSYQIYPIENSSPEHIADMLEQLIGKTTAGDKPDPEDKIVRNFEPKEDITIVPDPNSFSLLVRASGRNHQWITELINKLDKRRPQVLIDVTLVEVTRTDTFEYDLNLVANAKDAVAGNVAINSITNATGSNLEAGFNLTDQDGNPTGQTQAFYSDEKVQALLTAIQQKNYGRVLAKPKILVDDGQQGRIVTTDETTYVKESIQIPQTGTPITTRDFVPIEASIRLEITPHISEGELLRLSVLLSRDDFGNRPLSGAPPDKASSEVETTVFVPNTNTVILGGLVKLNQSKGGAKVPILGDVPLLGAAFRSVNNSDVERKLYVFLKANIVRPYEESKLVDLRQMSEEHQEAFEKSESEFQTMEDFPGIKPKPMQPERVLQDYR